VVLRPCDHVDGLQHWECDENGTLQILGSATVDK